VDEGLPADVSGLSIVLMTGGCWCLKEMVERMGRKRADGADGLEEMVERMGSKRKIAVTSRSHEA
jgi:hypothetical protein